MSYSLCKMNSDYIFSFFDGSHFTCAKLPSSRGIGVSISVDDKSMPKVDIFSTRQGWAVDSSAIGYSVNPHAQSYSIEEACRLAQGLLSSEYLPLKPEDIEISILRSQGVASQSITHKPTGIVRWIKDATGRGSIVSEQKEEALHEIVLELAEISNAQQGGASQH